MIIKNKAKCKNCGDILQSFHDHDCKTCQCGAISVDGGLSYIRRVGSLLNIEELSEFSEDDLEIRFRGVELEEAEFQLELKK